MNEQGKKCYYINLDPAVKNVPYAANIDIRDTVKYKEVMKQYGLGPNGSILTSLNLFATRFDQVIGLLDKRADDLVKEKTRPALPISIVYSSRSRADSKDYN